MTEKETLEHDRYAAWEAARELGYPFQTLLKLVRAKSGIEIDNILASARKAGKYEFLKRSTIKELLAAEGEMPPIKMRSTWWNNDTMQKGDKDDL